MTARELLEATLKEMQTLEIVMIIFLIIIAIWLLFSGGLEKFFAWVKKIRKIKTPIMELDIDDMDSSSATLSLQIKAQTDILMQRADDNAKNIISNNNRIEKVAETVKERITTVNEYMQKTDNNIKRIEDLLVNVTLDQKKHMVWNESLPIDERIYAGLSYISMGGNHTTRERTIELCRQYPDMYRMAVRAKPKFALKELEDLPCALT